MADYRDVCVLIPTLNEAATIGEVIDGFRDQGLDTILVIDGDSSDGTREIAEEHGARVVTQSGSGKGQAIQEALSYIDSEYVLMLDGDGTYRPEDAPTMLEPLLAGDAEHVIGNRFADMEEGAMTSLNQFGNGIIDRAFHYIHGKEQYDILSGYRAFTHESVDRLRLNSEGFGIETELAVECVKNGVEITEVPISYLARPESSETNLHPLWDGGTIILTLYRLAKTNNPLFYFGSVGLSGGLIGGGLAAYVGYEWFARGVSHEVIAIVAAFFVLFGVQLLIFGVLSDVMVTLHRDQMHRLERIETEQKRTDSPGMRDEPAQTGTDPVGEHVESEPEGEHVESEPEGEHVESEPEGEHVESEPGDD
ncbi:S-layer glycoprotein N-glycosyltransferase AglJ [Halostella pelagica]|uniref:S-layer glycoprotein N-glycosyltransferase AglJ n=1 Tax=Halostella pelagica TaxID=2583824 RepID=UPI00107FDC2E|nr:S-layer glycoprotein N-glycosyltransferase AglJ [Halostella pelagica]